MGYPFSLAADIKIPLLDIILLFKKSHYTCVHGGKIKLCFDSFEEFCIESQLINVYVL